MKQLNYQIINGNSAEVLQTFPDNHFDSVVCDPPYGINFLGKDWDANTGEEEVYRQCFRVLKPGGYILAFSAARTYHHLAMAVERSGFEIRDQIMWVYGSGFPKSHDVGRGIQKRLGVEKTKTIVQHDIRGKNGLLENSSVRELQQTVITSSEAQQWSGWGSALKPAHEPIVMARKPFHGSLIDNVQKWGTGALNIDGCRVALGPGDPTPEQWKKGWDRTAGGAGEYSKLAGEVEHGTAAGGKNISDYAKDGRYPANFIHDGSDEVLHLLPGNSQRFFYSAKVSRRERDIGCETLPQTKIETAKVTPTGFGGNWYCGDCKKQLIEHVDHSACDHSKTKTWRDNQPHGNNHPTVKPVALMSYLVKLVTPPHGHVLDPFNGSGSTGMAAIELGHQYTGIELDPQYCEIARRRIDAWNTPVNTNTALLVQSAELDPQLWEVQ